LIGVTPQGWMRAWDESGLVRAVEWADADKVLPRADVVIISEHDVANRSVIDDWASRARMLVVTLGERGSDVHRQGDVAAFGPQLGPLLERGAAAAVDQDHRGPRARGALRTCEVGEDAGRLPLVRLALVVKRRQRLAQGDRRGKALA
jgi:hypothetical protein